MGKPHHCRGRPLILGLECVIGFLTQQVAAIGQTSERWCFHSAEAIDAQKHALNINDDDHDHTHNKNEIAFSLASEINSMPFAEVPKDILKFDSWSIVQGRRWESQ